MSAAAVTPKAEGLTFEQLQQELASIPKAREAAIVAADVDAVRALREREIGLRTEIARIRVANLSAEVEKRQREVQEAMAAQAAANRESAAAIEKARADEAEAIRLQRDAERRHAAAIGQQEHARYNLESAQARLAEASTLRTKAMRELAESI